MEHKKMEITIRRTTENDFLEVYNFVSKCKPLENYFEHFYKIMLRYFGNTCFIAEFKKDIIGFIMGCISQVDPKTMFIWQIGVFSKFRGNEIGAMLLKELEKTAKGSNCERIELTIDPENISSQKFFEKQDYQNISQGEGDVIDVLGKTAVKDYYKPSRHFILYEKKLNL
jgi:diaminobutyrate acetyltransferase